MHRIGLVGAGNFARKHLAALQSLGERVDVVKASRARIDEPFPGAPDLPVVAFDDLIADDQLDAVLIASPNHLHRPQVEAALQAGKHVFCEKPLALSAKDADAAIEAARCAGRTLMVGHVTRHAPLYATAMQLVHEGRVGAVAAVHATRWHTRDKASDWRMRPDQGGGAPFDLLLHDYDLARWLCGDCSGVVAAGRKHALGGYERLAAVFAFPGGVQACVDGGFILPGGASMTSSLRIVGADGVIDVETPSDNPVRLRLGGGPVETVPVDPSRVGVDGLRSEWIELLDVVEGQAPRRLRLEDARQAVAMAAAAIDAANRDA